jgi:hypothetical protein
VSNNTKPSFSSFPHKRESVFLSGALGGMKLLVEEFNKSHPGVLIEIDPDVRALVLHNVLNSNS